LPHFHQQQSQGRVLLYSVEDELKTLEIAPQRIVQAQDLPVHKSSRAVCSAKNRFISTASELRDAPLDWEKGGCAQIKSPIASGSAVAANVKKQSRKTAQGSADWD
jgi:hypothetical protein